MAIAKVRLATITTHVKHTLSYLHSDMKASDTHKDTQLGYCNWREGPKRYKKVRKAELQ